MTIDELKILLHINAMGKFSDLFGRIDAEWIKNNPELMLEVYNLMCAELDRRKEVIENQHEKELLLSAMIVDREK